MEPNLWQRALIRLSAVITSFVVCSLLAFLLGFRLPTYLGLCALCVVLYVGGGFLVDLLMRYKIGK